MSRLCGIDYAAPSGRLLWGGLETQGAALGWIRLAFQAGICKVITGMVWQQETIVLDI